MRVRWSRVGAAVAGTVVGPPAAFFVAMGVTVPEPSRVVRSVDGTDGCVTSVVLEAGLPLHDGDHAPGAHESDALAADVLQRAARCQVLGEVDWVQLFDVYQLAHHGLAWTAEHEEGEIALEHALSALELLADQRRVGPLVNLAVANALTDEALDLAERELFGVSPDVRRAAGARLAAIATVPLDWDEIHVREERSMWGVLALSLQNPSSWPELPVAPKMLVEARRGTHPFVAEFDGDVRIARLRAASLAGAAGLADTMTPGDTCPEELELASAFAAAGIGLVVDPELCVVAATSEGDVRMASPWSGILDTLRRK